MIRFVFKDMTIREAHFELYKNIYSKIQLRNGEVAIIRSVSPVGKTEFSALTDTKKGSAYISEGTMNIDRFTKSIPMVGFVVTLQKQTKNGYEEWAETIAVPYAKEYAKLIVEFDYGTSILHKINL